MNSKVLIVGGGPAGAACAITTARAGLETRVFERGEKYRDKVCGDALVKDAQNHLDYLGVLENIRNRSLEVNYSNFIFPNGRSFQLDLPMLILQRRSLDQIMRDAILDLGGVVNHQTEIKKIWVTESGVKLRDNNSEEYSGDILVLATGSNIHLAQSLGFNFEKSRVSAIRGYALNKRGLNQNFVYLDKMNSGYGWVFPSQNKILNIGFHVSDTNRDSLRELFKNFINYIETHLTGDLYFLESPKGCPIRAGLRKGEIYSDRVVLVGENANTTYELTGEGITRSIESGIIAGEVINKSEPPYDARQLKKYEERIKTTMGDIHRSYHIGKFMFENGLTHSLFSSLFTRSSKARNLLSKFFNGESPSENVFSIRSQLKFWSSIIKNSS